MKYSKYDMVEFDDGTEYMVIDTLEKNGYTYVLLINPDDEKESFIAKEDKDELGTYLTRLPQEDNEYQLIAMEILKNNKEEMEQILEGLE
jgi:hypothetical protein